jgi:pyruvate-formate lyase-activating enzyme
MTKGYIRSILPFSSVDGPGNRTIVFFQGCGFRCGYCHNPETIPLGVDLTTNEVSLKSPEEVVSSVLKYRRFISGVTLSGGECTIQPDFLLELVQALKVHDLHILIDTNGDFDEALYKQLTPLIDGYMLDVKSVDPKAHLELTGRDNLQVLANLKRMARDHVLYEVRTVFVPKRLDNLSTVQTVSACLAELSPNTRYKLIRFRAHGVTGAMKNLSSPDIIEMEHYVNIAREMGLKQVILI